MIIDTHAHLYAEEFSEDQTEVFIRAAAAGVHYFLLPNINSESIPLMEKLMKEQKNTIPMMGLHPSYVKENWREELKIIETHLFKNPSKYCAVGEIGMDLFWDKTFIEAQKIVFRTQISWAKKLKLPIAIHARDAFDEIFEILDEENDETLKGVFHCFTGSIEQANKILDYGGFKLGIGGVITYKNSGLTEVLNSVELKHLVVETDAPYLSPAPFRGKRNESAYLSYIIEKISGIYKFSDAIIAEVTSQNAIELFQLEKFKSN
ncbi:MAG: TatD family deoxyribonuclease [Flavobacteriia bacterium]|nr:TatD family deoxyribonuclease [Flavobacteriia bacterium]